MSFRLLLKILIRVVLPIAVVVGVGIHFHRLLSNSALENFAVEYRPEWLIPAGVLYVLCHCIWGGFWTILLRRQAIPVSLLVGLRSYFVSQFGKYVPGKVWVIVIRVTMLGRAGMNKTAVAVTAFVEALTSQASGAVLVLILLPLIIENLNLPGVTYALVAVAAIPLGLVLLNRMVVRIIKKRRGPDAPPLPGIPFVYLVLGFVQTSLGWLLLGLSLWMTIQGLSPVPIPLTIELFGKFVAINAIAYVAGFIMLFAPAGAGVREGILQGLIGLELAGLLGQEEANAFAVVVALTLRLVWTIAELLMAGALYYLVPVKVIPKEAEESRYDR